MNVYVTEHYWTSFRFLIEIFKEEIEHVVTEKNEIKYGDESKL